MMIDRSKAPHAHEIQGIHLVSPTELVFENGLKVFCFHSEQQELVKAEFVFYNSYRRYEKPFLHAAMISLLRDGTTTMSGAEIANYVDFHGAFLVPEFSLDHSALTLYSLNRHVGKLFPFMSDLLRDASFPEEEIATYIRNQKQNLQISLEKNEYVAKRLFYQHVFPNNPYGYIPVEEDFDAIQREDIVTVYNEHITPTNAVLFLSGNITDEVLAAAEQSFGSLWQSNGTSCHREEQLALPAFEPVSLVEQKDDALQSAVFLGTRMIDRRHPDYPALQFVNTLFGGYFGSRLMQNIREDKGYTYGIHSSVASLKNTGLWFIATQVGVASTADTLIQIEKEIHRMKTELVSEEELTLVKNYLLGAMLGSLESIFSHVDKFKAVYFSDLELAYYARYTEVIKTMNSEKVMEIANRYWSYEKLTKVIVGKLED